MDAFAPDPNRGMDVPGLVGVVLHSVGLPAPGSVLVSEPIAVRTQGTWGTRSGVSAVLCACLLSRGGSQPSVSALFASVAIAQIDVATPDFSMLFNVVMLASVVIAYFCGNTINILARKPRHVPSTPLVVSPLT